MKIYTGTGDAGETGLFGGQRVSKASLRIGVIGDLDALNASLGLVAAEDSGSLFRTQLRTIQSALFDIGAEIATQPDKLKKLETAAISRTDVSLLESWIDEADEQLPPLKSFILPGGCPLSARLHQARTEARRAERALVALHATSTSSVRVEVLRYVNRLSDLCFMWARRANQVAQVEDVPWASRRNTNKSDEAQ